MGKTVKQRVGEYRERLKQQGMVNLSLVVPASEANFIREMANLMRQPRKSVAEESRRGNLFRGGLSASELRLAERWAARSGLKLRLTGPTLRLSEVLARNIAHEIGLARWPVGANLGKVPELSRRYEVSQKVLLDAVRILETQSIALMRRGPTGGLVVTEPTLDSAVFPAGVFLESRRIENFDLLQTRRGLELHILDRCFQKFDGAAHEALTQCLLFESSLDGSASGHDLQRFPMLLAKITGDPALELFLDILMGVTRFHSRYNREQKNKRDDPVNIVRRTHAAIARALIIGDRGKAAKVLNRFFDAYLDAGI